MIGSVDPIDALWKSVECVDDRFERSATRGGRRDEMAAREAHGCNAQKCTLGAAEAEAEVLNPGEDRRGHPLLHFVVHRIDDIVRDVHIKGFEGDSHGFITSMCWATRK